MITTILNIVGIILIVYSIYVIRKDIGTNNNVITDINLIEKRVKEYYNLTEEIIEEFSEIIDSKLEMINKGNNKNNFKELNPINDKGNDVQDHDNENIVNINRNPFHNKIIELHKIGLTNEEIAKKLNKGIREVDIILKIYGNNK